VRDAFGGTRELTSTYYLSASALAPGLHDYQYSVGFRRAGVGSLNWDYRTPAFLARHRVGVTSSLTLGARAESDFRDVFSLGPTINLRVPFGDFEGAASASRTDTGWGAAALGGFSFTSPAFSTGGSVTLANDSYATLSTMNLEDASVRQVNVFASSHLGGPITLTLQHAFDERLNGISRTRTGLLSTIRLGRRMELAVSATRVVDENGRDRELYAGLTYLFKRASVSLSHRNDHRTGSRFAVDAQQPVPVGIGYGAQLRVESGDGGDQITGSARYQGAHGAYEVRQERFGEHVESSVSTMGAIVAIGGSVHATRAVTESFALVRVPGVEGVRAYASNQEIGRTDKNGNLLIPNLQAYYGNVLGIDDADVPLLYSVANVRKLLAPPYRGGAVAEFPVERVQRIMGRVFLHGGGGPQTLAYGQIEVAVGSETIGSPLGGDGSFYFENLAPGRYPAVVEYRNGQCSTELVVPSSDELTVKLGEIECRRSDGQ
jgi:outer membrane usher protein